jgi:hypothetical protein
MKEQSRLRVKWHCLYELVKIIYHDVSIHEVTWKEH